MQTFGPHVDGYYDVSDQMIDDLRRRAEAHFRRQEAEKATLTSIAAFEEHRKRVRDSFTDAIGGLPEERTPMNVQCTGTLERGTFTIEKLIYDSLPEFYVTAALYVPKGLESPQPAIVFVHGHSDAGKSYPVYQAVCVDLANNGFVVLAVDPPGQGERFQYFDPETGKRIIGGCTTEHTYAGLQFTLGGASVGRHFIWDVMRGIDYLETRPEVDARRIGLTGNSGGGTQSCLLMMSEPRFAAAVPCTFVMTLESYMKTGQPQDSEQIVRGCFANGPDHDDYITAMAPKPVLVGAAAYDFFPIEGAMEAVNRAKKIYALYGVESKVDIAVAPTRHSYSAQLRQACVNWYKVHFRGEPPDFKTGEPETLPEDALWATPNGQVLDLYPHSKTVFDLNRQRLHLTPLPPLASPPSPPLHKRVERGRGVRQLVERGSGGETEHQARMRAAIVEALGMPDGREQPLYPRGVAENVVDGYRTEKVFFFSAPDIVVTGVVIHPLAGTPIEQTDLILFENGTNDIPNKRAWLEARLAAGRRLFVFDVRGVGGVQFRPFNRSGYPHAATYKLGSDAMMLGISTMGLRVFDVLRGYDYLRTRGDVDRIGLYGIGKGAFYAYFAGALEEGFSELVFEDLLYSYRHLTDTRYYNQELYNLEVMAWGLLRHFDLVDLVPCFGERPFRWISPRDAKGEVLTDEAFDRHFLRVAREQGYLRDKLAPSLHSELALSLVKGQALSEAEG